jgi:hypothetical protein
VGVGEQSRGMIARMPTYLLLGILAGWLNRQQQAVIDYLRTENEIFKRQLKGRRPSLSDDERRRLAVKGKALGRKVLGEIACIVTPETILAWHRRLVATKLDIRGERGLDRFVDTMLAAETPVALADLAAGSGRDTFEWIDTMFEGLAAERFRFTAVATITWSQSDACQRRGINRHAPISSLARTDRRQRAKPRAPKGAPSQRKRGRLWVGDGGHHLAVEIIRQAAGPVAATGASSGNDYVVVERDGGQHQGPTAAAGDGAESDTCARKVISRDLIVGTESDGAPGVPEDADIAAAIGTQIDNRDRRIHSSGERGADLENPEHVVLSLGVERECSGQRRRSVKRINTRGKCHPTQIHVAQIHVGRHASQTDGGRDEIQPRLTGNPTGADDRSSDNHRRRKPGDPGGCARSETDVPVDDRRAKNTGAGYGRAAEKREVTRRKQD